MNEIRLIASDMDGTLLTSDKKMPADFARVLHALREKGVTFAVASGRQYDALRRDFGELASQIMFIAENGALVVENDERLFIDPVPAHELPDIIRAGRGLEGVYAVVCRAGAALVESSASQAFIDEMKMYYPSTQVVPDLAAASEAFDDVCKVAFYDEGDAKTHEMPVLEERLGDRLAVILSGANWVDIMKPGVNKGRAMRILQEQRGLSPQQCMAFGDYLNDLELLESVGESYAMDNALPEIKAAAKYIAPGNDEDGVMRVIRERFGL